MLGPTGESSCPKSQQRALSPWPAEQLPSPSRKKENARSGRAEHTHIHCGCAQPTNERAAFFFSARSAPPCAGIAVRFRSLSHTSTPRAAWRGGGPEWSVVVVVPPGPKDRARPSAATDRTARQLHEAMETRRDSSKNSWEHPPRRSTTSVVCPCHRVLCRIFAVSGVPFGGLSSCSCRASGALAYDDSSRHDRSAAAPALG